MTTNIDEDNFFPFIEHLGTEIIKTIFRVSDEWKTLRPDATTVALIELLAWFIAIMPEMDDPELLHALTQGMALKLEKDVTDLKANNEDQAAIMRLLRSKYS